MLLKKIVEGKLPITQHAFLRFNAQIQNANPNSRRFGPIGSILGTKEMQHADSKTSGQWIMLGGSELAIPQACVLVY